MAVPKKKTSKSKRDMRRSHDGLASVGICECPRCGATKLPHRVCNACGWYNDKRIISIARDKDQIEEEA